MYRGRSSLAGYKEDYAESESEEEEYREKELYGRGYGSPTPVCPPSTFAGLLHLLMQQTVTR